MSYTVDDLTSAGWKKSKDFGVETLPGAKQAIFAFYNQRDIEGLGVPLACRRPPSWCPPRRAGSRP